MKLNCVILMVLTSVFYSCSEGKGSSDEGSKDSTNSDQKESHDMQVEPQTDTIKVEDHHSLSNVKEVYGKHLHLDVKVDFDSKTISGVASYDIAFAQEPADSMVFDTWELDIEKVTLNDGEPTDFHYGKEDELLGKALVVDITEKTKKVNIHYTTSPESKALQWLSKEQTAGKEEPFMFTQGQAILTRTWIPCQDTPMKRLTYSAEVEVPEGLMAVMSAKNPQEISEDGRYSFKMEQPIPIYLMAMAVGDIRFEPIGERTGVYTEPAMMEEANYELEDMESMLLAAEKLYGDYKWGRYDVIILPPSFPFGGMENPRLTFATPTILAGDKSLVSLIAHELAHSWSGNLVTNATWNDFWLNEGFTVYFENRIMEELYGKEYADMLLLLNERGLKQEITQMRSADRDRDTYLKQKLKNRNPDDAMNAIAYDKGAFFLRMLENKAGRERFDKFLAQYFREHQFTNVTTEEFLAYLDKHLLDKYDLEVDTDQWVYGPGLPDSHIEILSDKFKNVDQSLQAFYNGKEASEIDHKDWSTHEYLHFIGNIQDSTTVEELKELDKALGFSKSGNAEILSAWFVTSIQHGYWKHTDKMEDFLISVGRRKFLQPIYSEMAKSEKGMQLARNIYAKARKNYHSVSKGTIDDILNWQG